MQSEQVFSSDEELDSAVHQEEERKFHFIFIAHLLIQILFQWLDLFATQRMITLNGLHFEANEWAKAMFQQDPQAVEVVKIMLVPAVILGAVTASHFRFFQLRHTFTRKDFEYIPFRLLQAMNVGMSVAVLIVAYSDELKRLSLNSG